ncbi:MAG: amino acid ABC transporter substrate-binding protein [Thermoleophilaceae bacterium]|nr:amino acid ABC transporter substrate-binding protein [Thermoleophilaceae bacterium]
MTRIARRALPVLCVGLAGLLAACGGSSGDNGGGQAAANAPGDNCTPKYELPTIKKGTLTVVGPMYPPLFTYKNGEVGGVDGDELKQIAKDACLKLEVHIQPAAGVIASVQSGRADIAAGGWYISPERAKIVGQTEPNYADPPELVSRSGANDIEAFRGKKIGTTQGYLWEADFKKFAGSNGKLYQSPDAVFADLQAGRIEAGLMAVNEAGYRLRQHPNSGLKGAVMKPTKIIAASVRPSVTNFPHTKGKPELTKALNQAIESMRRSGQLEQILKKYGLDPKAAYPKG